MSDHDEAPKATGIIAWWANNAVAANLLMLIMLLGGIANLWSMKQEVFPEFTLDIVTVTVPYPGASPDEVEQGIALAVEEAVRGVTGVKKVTSISSEGVGVVSVELLLGADPAKAVEDIRNEVDRLRTLPEEAEDPQVVLVSRQSRVVGIVLHGDVARKELKALAEHVRQDLITRKVATQIEIEGLPAPEIHVEVRREVLQAYGLTLDDVARQVTAGSLDLPAGAIEAASGEVLLRVADRKETGDALAEMVIKGARGGNEVRLGEIAVVRDDFVDDDRATFFNGDPAAQVVMYRSGDERPTDISDAAKAYLEELRPTLPAGVEAELWSDESERLRGRIDLLTHDGMTGLALLFLALALFLDLRLAFWVAFGIPTSVLAAFLFLPSYGISINMISLFAFIITLGIVADDAIVVSENFYEKRAAGMPPLQAAIEGCQEIVVPVTFSVMTAGVAFSPLLFVPGVSGKIFGIIPIIVIVVLFTSLVECYLILPAHLAHSSQSHRGPIGMIAWVFAQPRKVLDVGVAWLVSGPYTRTLTLAASWRYTTVAISMAVFLITLGYVSNLMAFTFLPRIPSDSVRMAARLPYGTPVEKTEEVRAQAEQALQAAIAELDAASGVRGQLTLVGQGPQGAPGSSRAAGGHLLAMEVELVPLDQRAFTSGDLEAAWQRHMPRVAGLEAITFNSDIGVGGGAAVDVQISAPDEATLARTSQEVTEQLRTYPALKNIDNTYASGKAQLDVSLLPAARTLGLTSADVARQLRSAFYGAEAIREQRERDEIKVMVRLPEAQRLSEHDLDQLQIRLPTGGWAPLGSVAEVVRSRAPTSITREDGRRVVDVKAELAPGYRTAQPVIDDLSAEGGLLATLERTHPGLRTRFAGERESQDESLASLGKNYIIALFCIYALLAVPFKSYLQPLVIMIAIPGGFIGAIGGHILHGFEMSIISIMGIIAASGVVLNDSVVMVDAINQFRAEGMTAWEAMMAAGQRRLRPIVLNSVTTYLGLGSTLYETSVQARFLIPMAIGLAYGVAFATIIALLVVPAAYLITEDVRDAWQRSTRWLLGLYWPEPEGQEGK